MCYCFHKVSFHLLKFLLIPSIFRRSAVQILSFLFLDYTIAVSNSFVIRELLLHVFQPTRSSLCSLFLFSNGVFIFVHLRCILLSSLLNLSRFFGFTRLSKKQLCFTSSSSVFFTGAISRISGRDPLLVWESCDARDRRPRRFQKLPEDSRCSGLPVCSFVVVLFIFALHHVIIPSCLFILHLNLNKSCGPSVHLNRGKVTSLYNI